MCSADGDALIAWASANNLTLLYDPKEPASFHSQGWNSDTNPDLAFAHTADTGIPTRRVLDKFPRSQHRPSLISSPCLAAPIACKPVKRWNFRKASCREAKRELNVNISGRRLTCHRTPIATLHGVKLDRTLTYREHLTALRGKIMARTALIRR